MVRQYPYQLWVKTFQGEAIRNEKGQYTPAGSTFVNASSCRDEANSKGQTVILEDQTVSAFDWLIQLPLSCPDVKAGASIEVRNASGQVRVSGTAKRFSRDQLHCRLWV